MDAITKAAIGVELARAEAEHAHKALVNAIVYVDATICVEGDSYNDPRSASEAKGN